MKQNWLAKNILSNVVVIITYLILVSENIPTIPALIVGYIASMVSVILLFLSPMTLRKGRSTLATRRSINDYCWSRHLVLSIINATAICFIWQWIITYGIDGNTGLVWTILFYNAGCTLFDRHAMKMVEEELR